MAAKKSNGSTSKKSVKHTHIRKNYNVYSNTYHEEDIGSPTSGYELSTPLVMGLTSKTITGAKKELSNNFRMIASAKKEQNNPFGFRYLNQPIKLPKNQKFYFVRDYTRLKDDIDKAQAKAILDAQKYVKMHPEDYCIVYEPGMDERYRRYNGLIGDYTIRNVVGKLRHHKIKNKSRHPLERRR